MGPHRHQHADAADLRLTKGPVALSYLPDRVLVVLHLQSCCADVGEFQYVSPPVCCSSAPLLLFRAPLFLFVFLCCHLITLNTHNAFVNYQYSSAVFVHPPVSSALHVSPSFDPNSGPADGFCR